jgi:hypothetical protein
MALVLGSHPRFPAASKKRGMARAIEIVAWMKDYADAREGECLAAGHLLTADVFRGQAHNYGCVLDALRGEHR